MRVTVKQMAVSALAFVLTFGLLWLGRQAYQRLVVNRPLTTALRRIPGISRVRVLPGGDVAITLAPAAVLPTVYQAAVQAAAAAGQPASRLTLVAPANTTLENLTQAAALVVAQGIATGHYDTMAHNLRQDAQRVGAQAAVAVADNAVFVTFRQGTARDYLVVPAHAYLHPTIAQVAVATGGTHD